MLLTILILSSKTVKKHSVNSLLYSFSSNELKRIKSKKNALIQVLLVVEGSVRVKWAVVVCVSVSGRAVHGIMLFVVKSTPLVR